MGTSSIRVLIVEDYEPFRRFLVSKLREHSELQIIGEVSDGLEAVQKAEELQPDLILLDIGLPTLNGIEVACQIRKLSPTFKIIFVTQESSADLVKEALNLGACGYVVKADAGGELLAAVNAVLRDEQFVGNRFAGYGIPGASNLRAADPRFHEVVPKAVFASSSPPAPRKAEVAHRHEVQFYSDDSLFLDGLTQFIGNALKAGSAVIVVATESHREKLLLRLQVHGLDIAAAIEQGRYTSLDAADALSTFMVKGMPDPVRFVKLFGNLIATAAEAAKRERSRVMVFGEGVQVLWAQGNADAVIQVEQLASQLAKTYDVDILCGYSLDSVHGVMDRHIFQRICAEHSAVYSG